jgi:hypothetical protein
MTEDDIQGFLRQLSVHDLCLLIDDVFYQNEQLGANAWLGTARHAYYVRAVKLGLSNDRGARLCTELLWRLHYTAI